MNTLIQECMNSIDKLAINDYNAEVQESMALLDVYTKAANILRYSAGSDLSSCRSFMEYAEPMLVVQESDDELWTFKFRHDKRDGSGQEHMFWSLLLAIPRLFAAIFTFIGKGLTKLLTGETSAKAASKDAAKAVADEVGDDVEKLLKASNELIAKAIADAQAAKLKGMKDNAFACTMLNKEAFDESNFKALRAGTYEGAFYIMPPFSIPEYIEELKKYGTEVIGKFTYDTSEEFEKILTDAGATEEFRKRLMLGAVKSLEKMLNESSTKLTKAKSVRQIQHDSGKAWVSSIDGYDPEASKMTPAEFYKSLNELQKLTKLNVDEANKLKAEIERLRSAAANAGTAIPTEWEAVFKQIIDYTQKYNESMLTRTTMIFDIPANYISGVQSIKKNRKSIFEIFKGKDNAPAGDETMQKTRENLEREIQAESAVPDVRDAYYQDDNITAAAY